MSGKRMATNKLNHESWPIRRSHMREKGFLFHLLLNQLVWKTATMCPFRKYLYTHQMELGFPKGWTRVSVRPKKLKKCVFINCNFQRGCMGSYKNSLPWGSYRYFLELEVLLVLVCNCTSWTRVYLSACRLFMCEYAWARCFTTSKGFLTASDTWQTQVIKLSSVASNIISNQCKHFPYPYDAT